MTDEFGGEMVRGTLRRATVVVALAVGTGALGAPPVAAAPGGCGLTCADEDADGGWTGTAYNVTVTTRGANAAGGGGSTYTVPGPPPPCYYTPGSTAQEQQIVTNWSDLYSSPAEIGYDPETLMPFGHEQNLLLEGRYYVPMCGGEQTDAEADAWFAANDITFIEVNEPVPPPPPPSVEELLEIGKDNLDAPAPEVNLNPGARSYVNLPTWVWTDDATFEEIGVRVQAGPNWVDLTALPAGMTVSSQAGTQVGDCASGGTPWTSGATVTDCSHVFDQASVSGTWALQVETNWTASYVNSEGGGGGLEAQTAATTVDVPVAEVQTLVRS